MTNTKMLHQSLATFMNAFTASDFTISPSVTTSKSGLQQGWRLEHKLRTDPSTPIHYAPTNYHPVLANTL
ncbi:hypothetical protein BC941DRAFT_413880 [Chlamydoabsidia padenii]|nr:hypothetical protein BC941DRAFT_413880 [Chlamydoabsidia padenii]